jgi:hypothetical protein
MEADFKRYARTQELGGRQARRIAEFAAVVARVHRKQLDGQMLTADDYVELSVLGGMLYRQGDYYTRPEVTKAACQTVIDTAGHPVSSG